MIHNAIFVGVLHVINQSKKTFFQGLNDPMIYSDGLEGRVIHTSLLLYLLAFIYTFVHTSILPMVAAIVNEIMCIKDIWDKLKRLVSGSYYYRKQQSKVFKNRGFGTRSFLSRILALLLIGC